MFVGTLFLFFHQHRSVVRVMGGLVQEFSLRFKDFPSCTALVAGGNLWGGYLRLARKPLSRVFRETFLFAGA